jgi:ubiquinone/menaquinone biosynthesis C-methylase UbiE
MTGALAARFDHVVAVDVSPGMIARAREEVTAANVEFREVSGERLDGVADGSADVAVCYLVLQHLPSRRLVRAYVRELARVLRPGGEAFVQLPVLSGGIVPRLWRALRTPFARVSKPELRGVRLTRAEFDRAIAGARLTIVATDVGPDSPYRFSTDLFLRLRR